MDTIDIDGKKYVVTPGYTNSVGILGDDTGQYVEPQACKDYLHDALQHHYYPKVAAKLGTSCVARSKQRKPAPFFQIGHTGTANLYRENIDWLETKLDLNMRTRVVANIQHGKGSGKMLSAIVEAPPWWIRSPVLLSLWLTILRHSFMDTTWDVSKHGLNPNEGRKPTSVGYTATFEYLRMAQGNIAKCLQGDLPCQNREGYSDYILSNHGRGIASYQPQVDGQFPYTEEELLANLSKRGY